MKSKTHHSLTKQVLKFVMPIVLFFYNTSIMPQCSTLALNTNNLYSKSFITNNTSLTHMKFSQPFGLDSSELPIIIINTLGKTIVPDTKVDCLMNIKYKSLNNGTFDYSGAIGIEIRGASSASYLQPSFGFETRTSTGTNNDVSILGMPAENDWVLLSNFNDKSLIRNLLAYTLFGKMGNYSTRANLCEVLIDDNYKGIYVLAEKIKRDNNRVNIAKLTTADSVGDNLTGGYILQQNYGDGNNSFSSKYSPRERDGFNVHFLYEYPKSDKMLTVQKTYIASYIDSLEKTLYGLKFMDDKEGYKKYLDVKSFIDYFILNELSRNQDGFKKSFFMYKDKQSNGGKLKAGPVWDFDWAWKNISGCSVFENTDGSGWAHHINNCPTNSYSTDWYIRLLQDPTFKNELINRYKKYRKAIFDTTYIFGYIDSISTLVQKAQIRHFQKWTILGISGPAPEIGIVTNTYSAELANLKVWINRRLQWLDKNISKL